MHFDGIVPFKMHKILFFPEKLKKILGFTSKFRLGRVTLNTDIFLFGLNSEDKMSCSFTQYNVSGKAQTQDP